MKKNRLSEVIVFSILIMTTLIGCSSQKSDTIKGEKLKVVVDRDYPHYSSIDDLSQKADIVIEGAVVNSRVEELEHVIEPSDKSEKSNPGGNVPSSKRVYTIYTVEVSDSFKGNINSGETIEVKETGGEGKGAIYVSNDSIELKMNKKYIMFLNTYDNSPATLLNPIQSLYTYDEESLNNDQLKGEHKENDLSLKIKDLEKIKSNNNK